MKRKEARAVGAIFYTGKVCKRHPEEKGRRRVAQGNCHACIVERMASPRSREKLKEARRRRFAAIKAGTWTFPRRAGGVT
jgi:hypothetical protein